MARVRLDGRKLLSLTGEMKAAALEVIRGMSETPGGDAYTYNGSMEDVGWLQDSVNAYEDYLRTGE